MTASTQADVIDLLLTGIRANLADQTILVSDAFPPGAYQPNVMVAVGGLSSATAAGTQAWAYLGAKSKFETYKVKITISVVYGGDGQQAEVIGADAQKAARDMAYAVAHSVEGWLQGDPTLGQYFNTGARGGGWISLTDMTLKQTDDLNAAVGVIAEITLQAEVYCRIT